MAFRHRQEASHDHRGFKTALIVGAGSGLSAALARALAAEGIKVALAARSTADLADLAKEIGAQPFTCDAQSAPTSRSCSPTSMPASARRRS